MASQTKADILKRHQANARLNAPLPPQVMQNSQDLSADSMPSPLDERIIAAASHALESGQTHYVDVPGIAPLRAAAAEHLNRAFGASYQSANILITAGLQEARFLTIQKISEQYESSAIPEVVHPGVRKALGVRARRIASLPVDWAMGGLPSIESIAQAARAGNRLFYLESPSRLSGARYAADDVSAIHKLAAEHNAAVIWDQGLAAWIDGDYASLAALDSEVARTAVISEVWPGMGLAGWFIGCIAAPEAWIAPMQSQKQIMAICTSTAAQYAALEAAKLYAESHPKRLRQLSGVKSALLETASQAGFEAVAGDAVNILALRLPRQNAADGLARLRQAGFEAAAGSLFGAPDLIRLNVGSSTAPAIQQIEGETA